MSENFFEMMLGDDGATASSTNGEAKIVQIAQMTFQATNVIASGTGAVVVVIEASDEKDVAAASRKWVTLGTITLSSTTLSDGFASNAPWALVRARAVTVTPGSTVKCRMSRAGIV